MRQVLTRLLGRRSASARPVLQEHFLRLALKEIGITGGRITIPGGLQGLGGADARNKGRARSRGGAGGTRAPVLPEGP